MSTVKRAVKAVLHEPPRKKAKRPAAGGAPRKRAPSSPRSNPATAPAAATAPAPAATAPAPAAPDKETEARAREGGPTGILLGGLLMLGGVVTVVSAVNGQLASFMAGFSAADPK